MFKANLMKLIGLIKANRIISAVVGLVIISSIGVPTALAIINQVNDSKKDNICIVQFDSSGGTSIDPINIECGKKINEPINPQKEGFTFEYWKYNNKKYDFSKPMLKSTILKAVYKITDGTEIVKVFFDTGAGTKIDTIELKKGESIVKPSDPIMKDYQFIGWYKEDIEFDFNNPITEDIILVAKYSKLVSSTSNNNKSNSKQSKVDCEFYKNQASLQTFSTFVGTKQYYSSYFPISAYSNTNNVCKLTFDSSDSSVASIDEKGFVLAKKVGSTQLRICLTERKSNVDIDCYSTVLNVTNNTSWEYDLNVMPTSVTCVSNDLELGNISYMAALWTPTKSALSATVISYTSSNSSIIEVLEKESGQVKAVGVGTATITVKSSNGLIGTCNVKVIPKVIHVEAISISGKDILNVGESAKLVANVSPNNVIDKSITWSSSNSNIARIDNYGNITGVVAGEAYIYAKANDNQMVASKKITVKSIRVSSISLNHSQLSMNVGESSKLSANIQPGNATNKNVTWSSSNNNIATVDNNGRVTAVGKGTTIITATTEDGNKQAKCNVSVSNVPVSGINLNNNSIDLIKGNSSQLNATILPSNATNKNVTWSSSSNSVATVDNNGRVTAIGKGTAIITATTSDGSKTANCNVSVTNPPLSAKGSIGIATIASNSGISRGINVTVTASGGAGNYNYYYIKLYKDGNLISQTSNTSSNSLFASGYTNGNYYAEIEVHDTDGEVYTGTTGTSTISGF